MLGSKNMQRCITVTYSGSKTIHSNIQHVHHNSLNIKYECRSEIDKNTYLVKNSSHNQLRCCNVPPNHRPLCSSISQQHCYPQAGHDSSKDKGQRRLTHSRGVQISQTNTTGFIRPSTDRPSQHSPRNNHCIPAARQPFTALWRRKNNQEKIPSQG